MLIDADLRQELNAAGRDIDGHVTAILTTTDQAQRHSAALAMVSDLAKLLERTTDALRDQQTDPIHQERAHSEATLRAMVARIDIALSMARSNKSSLNANPAKHVDELQRHDVIEQSLIEARNIGITAMPPWTE